MKRISLVLTMIVLLGSALLYQNCGQVRVAPAPNQPSSVPQYHPKGYFCSEVGPSYTTPLKILFVTDMSLSNLGGSLNYNHGMSGADPFRWTLGKWYKEAVAANTTVPGFDMNAVTSGFPSPQALADTIVVSDGDGKRFQAMQKFVDPQSICSQIGTNFSYGVVGFSQSAMLPRVSGQTCESNFTSDRATFSDLINGLKQYQDLDLADPKSRSRGAESPYTMADTQYMKGLSCMTKKIERDALFESDNLPFYYIVFMSDGMPSDRYNPCPIDEYANPSQCQGPQFQTCRLELWRQCLTRHGISESCYGSPLGIDPNFQCIRAAAIPKAVQNLKDELEPVVSGFKFQPVFYWPQGQAGDQFDQAAAVMQPLATIGGVPGIIRLQDDTAMLQLEQKICSTIETSMRVQYTIKNYTAINLTARLSKGVLKADSDMDGVVDELESASSATNPRSQNNVLDGFCKMEPMACQQARTCNPNLHHSLGLTDCDIAFMREMTANPVSGIDSNANGILDFVELIKGGNPLSSSGTMNGDGDSYPIQYEIAKGYDIQSNDDLYPAPSSQLMKANFAYSQDSSMCGEGEEAMKVSLENIPLVNVRAFTDSRVGPLNLSHGENENIIAITYTVSPVGGLPSSLEKTFVHVLRVPVGSPPELTINPSNFIEVQGAP